MTSRAFIGAGLVFAAAVLALSWALAWRMGLVPYAVIGTTLGVLAAWWVSGWGRSR